MGRKGLPLSLPANRIVLGFYPEDYLAVAGEGGAERLVGMSLGWFPSRHLVSLRGQPVDNWPRSPTLATYRIRASIEKTLAVKPTW